MSPPLPTTRPPGLSATQPSGLPPSGLPPPPYLPTPPTPTRLPLVGIDCTSVGVTHQPYDGGYLNVEVPLTPTLTLTLALAPTLAPTLTHVSGGAPRAATLPGARARGVRPAAERLDERAGQRRLSDLTNPNPSPSPSPIPSPSPSPSPSSNPNPNPNPDVQASAVSSDREAAARRRAELREIMEHGLAEVAPDRAAGSSEHPLMLWAVARRAVLVTNLNFGDQLGAYQVPAQQDACRAWLRSWVCTFEFRPRGGRSGAPLDFVPRPTFVMPPLPVEGVVGLPPSLHETLETSFSAQVALIPPLVS